jgi:hypothetical protein
MSEVNCGGSVPDPREGDPRVNCCPHASHHVSIETALQPCTECKPPQIVCACGLPVHELEAKVADMMALLGHPDSKSNAPF